MLVFQIAELFRWDFGNEFIERLNELVHNFPVPHTANEGIGGFTFQHHVPVMHIQGKDRRRVTVDLGQSGNQLGIGFPLDRPAQVGNCPLCGLQYEGGVEIVTLYVGVGVGHLEQFCLLLKLL